MLYAKMALKMNSVGEAIGMNGKYQPKTKADRWPNPTYSNFEEGLEIVQGDYLDLNRRFAALAPRDESRQRFFVLEYAHVLGHLVVNSQSANFVYKLGEKALVDAIEKYEVESPSLRR